ncbi:hypothetical protein D1AOALGA4SA_13197 [Olavius algarvensis Delta 1 endosymbiont]|nr:hypothetical protein D1AOALGA4SA_13197 [Olavius algarvensis Delta 1 endosymbiont]
MEYWEYKADDGLILQTDPCRPYKNRPQSTKPSIPSFQNSIIPLPLAADSRHSRLALTWPRGTGFLRQNKSQIAISNDQNICDCSMASTRKLNSAGDEANEND